ncbi:isoprenylcysteine carboxylmethyltransferase family protein [Rodentibacter sp. Ppn85]|uniref:methyltransferase family protein n=1 Tax=Rodentibacter sp. Ppn85 TaxID=1908525 RepID=UPI000986DC2C|nr:isoprenylcysteine carboxylmethyltransferase family protein [Rodentibacter sp. Ppn85]OOF65917.1 isoprenylcysteine carboxyl methyltransferase [Rodentibacter sp. Ppn85]
MRFLFPLPPPILCFTIGVLMYALPKIGQYSRFFYAIWFFILLSILVAVAGLWQFYRNDTSIDPKQLDKTTRLVTSGIFQITRNPIYLSLLLILVSWALWLGHLLAWSGVITFILLMNRFQISREEIYLEKKFGDTYRRYKSKVRRWI